MNEQEKGQKAVQDQFYSCLLEIKKQQAVDKALNEKRDQLIQEIRGDLKELSGKIDILTHERLPSSHFQAKEKTIDSHIIRLSTRIEEVNDSLKIYTIKLLTLGLVGAGVLFSLIQIVWNNLNP